MSNTPRRRSDGDVYHCAVADRRPSGAPPWACDDRAFRRDEDAINILRGALVGPGQNPRAQAPFPKDHKPLSEWNPPQSQPDWRKRDGVGVSGADLPSVPAEPSKPAWSPRKAVDVPRGGEIPREASRGNEIPRTLSRAASAPKPAPSPRQPAVRSGPGVSVRASTPPAQVRSQARVSTQAQAPKLDSTLRPQPLYVGDRVRVVGSSRTGEVMYVGTATFFGGKQVVGIRLDTKRSTSDCDGKFERERYFRCKPGHGIYLPASDVERIPDEEDPGPPDPEVDDSPFDLQQALGEMVGQAPAKTALQNLRNLVEVQRKRAAVGLQEEKPLLFTVCGAPGTGTSYIGKLLARLLRELGVVERGHVVEATRVDMVDDAEKRVDALVKRAAGGVLLVDNAHLLKDPERTDSAGAEVVAELKKKCELMARKVPVRPQQFCLVLAGPRAELQAFLHAQSIKAQTIELVGFSSEELAQILARIVAQRKFALAPTLQAPEALADVVRRKLAQQLGRGGQNLRLVQQLLEDAIARQATRVWECGTVSLDGLTMLVEEDFTDPEPRGEEETAVQRSFDRLDGIVGLDSVKAFVRSLHDQILVECERRAAGIESNSVSTLHMVFQGNPGTGKTTVGRIVAEMLKAIGWLKSGHLVEADRGQLVAGYAGQTAIKTKQVVESALGGVLFIDEAYALVQGDKDSFGREALDTLIKLVEDYRAEVVVIIAGYSDNMAELMKKNPGLRSRFPTTINFANYSLEEMMTIAERMLLSDVLIMDEAGNEKLVEILTEVTSLPNHANGRAVRNIVEQAKRNQAGRLSKMKKKTRDDLCLLTEADFENIAIVDAE